MTAIKKIEVSDPQEEIITSCYSRNLFLAGVGSGKSHTGGLISADFIRNFPHVRGFIGANTNNQLSRSTLDRIFKVWAEVFGWKRDVHYTINKTPPKSWIKFGEQFESYEKIICFNNGAVIFTSSLENYTAIDGVEFAWAVLDETKDTREEAVKEVIIARLRQSGMYLTESGNAVKYDTGTAFNPLYILTSPAKVQWLNEWFDISDQGTVEEIHRHIFSKTDYYVRVKDGKKVVISSTYHNEDNLPQGYIDNLIRDYSGNENRLNMLIYASPVAKTGGEYITKFERNIHVKPVVFDKEKSVHTSFDFNVTPYNTLLLSHVVKLQNGKYQIQIFAEICLESPRNRTEENCRDAWEKYVQYCAGVYFTGDASGKNRTTTSNEHNFDIIERMFRRKLTSASDRRFKRNPSLQKSRDFIEKILFGGFDMIEPTIIDPSCKRLITDLEFLKEAPDGSPLKQTAKGENGETYEKYGHLYDAFKYLHIATYESFFDAW
jgi:hypothetical protein